MTKPISNHPDRLNAIAWRDSSESRLLHLVELLKRGDKVHPNKRKNPLVVTDVSDLHNQRVYTLRGNETTYSLCLSRFNGYPQSVLLQYPSGQETVSQIKVTDRNPLNIEPYDNLLTEEVEEQGDTDVLFCDEKFDALTWAVEANLHHDRKRHFHVTDNNPPQLSESMQEYYNNTLSIWERIRQARNSDQEGLRFYGRELGVIGACLDYAVENETIASTLPDIVVTAIDRTREGHTPSGFLPYDPDHFGPHTPGSEDSTTDDPDVSTGRSMGA